ncbi:MAG: UDP-2,4-diacetamido-2,4,6-trideoxy-beta-L-altropyranose hydrolase [Campylobacterales bacterium]|nr:UDP-2,4-diacetamido-2,4,6-trideoxy-beta-L-altropyranose hydrolase [Campylobacterales bacterium]
MNILIRADSSSTLGTGHIMRDLVLASQLQEQYPHAKILFATQALLGNINHKIIEAGYELINLNSNAKEELLEIINTRHVDMLVIDHYGIDYAFENFIKKNVDVKILVFDDTYEKHNCDILLNHNICANPKRYKNLVPSSCELRCGSNYTLLRDEFHEEKKAIKYKNRHLKYKILIAMGGTDNTNLNIKLLEILKKFKNIEVNLVTTTANKNLKKLQNYAKNKKWVALHINTTKMAQLMAEANLGIITPSVSANEAVFMKLDFIAVQIASNQVYMAQYLKHKRYFIQKRFNAKTLKIKLQKRINR